MTNAPSSSIPAASLYPASDAPRFFLALESSCDETAVAILEAQGERLQLRANLIASQVDLHARYGGVVPEMASREHLKKILPLLTEAFQIAGVTPKDLAAIAVTQGPGLLGALLIAVQVAKSLSYVWRCPLIGVHHLEGHIEAAFLEQPSPTFPFVCLLVSGGHTALYHVSDHLSIQILGQTRDDAAGEAFDKAAKMLGLGYPGGVAIDRLASTGDPKRFSFPQALLLQGLDFSFSGLKTSCRTLLQKYPSPPEGQELSDLCASYQEAIVEVLWAKTHRALEETRCKNLVVGGGVAANSRLRSLFSQRSLAKSVSLFLPSRSLCTDNAAMIAVAGYRRFCKGAFDTLDLNALAQMPIGQTRPTSPLEKR